MQLFDDLFRQDEPSHEVARVDVRGHFDFANCQLDDRNAILNLKRENVRAIRRRQSAAFESHLHGRIIERQQIIAEQSESENAIDFGIVFCDLVRSHNRGHVAELDDAFTGSARARSFGNSASDHD